VKDGTSDLLNLCSDSCMSPLGI